MAGNVISLDQVRASLKPKTDRSACCPEAASASLMSTKCSGGISPRDRQLLTAEGQVPASAAILVGPPRALMTASTELSILLHTSRNVKMSSLHAKGIVTKCESGKNALMTRSLPDVCRRLVATQQALGISPAELSRQSHIPANQWTQFTDPKYKRRITMAAAYKLKDAFGITLEWIFDGDKSRLPHEIANKLKKAA